MLALAVDPGAQKAGVGRSLVQGAEKELRQTKEGRILLIETAGTDEYQGARTFYAKNGFVQEARIREFYSPTEDKAVFWKRL